MYVSDEDTETKCKMTKPEEAKEEQYRNTDHLPGDGQNSTNCSTLTSMSSKLSC